MMIRYIFYRSLMKLAHKYNWHYAPPIYPDGDTMLWCKWCGFREIIKIKKYEKKHNTSKINGLRS